MTAVVDPPLTHHGQFTSWATPDPSSCDCRPVTVLSRWSLACPVCEQPAVWSLGEHGLVCGRCLHDVLTDLWSRGPGFVPPCPVPVSVA